jgi:hypothetical protein
MSGCLEQNFFAPLAHAGVYVERSRRRTRQGLVVAIHLDQYDWRPGTYPLIYLTEDTVTSRPPPRMVIHRGTPFESPHIILLIDDPSQGLFTGLAEIVKSSPAVYTDSLMLGAGNITS